jgi:hypothetical protein
MKLITQKQNASCCSAHHNRRRGTNKPQVNGHNVQGEGELHKTLAVPFNANNGVLNCFCMYFITFRVVRAAVAHYRAASTTWTFGVL